MMSRIAALGRFMRRVDIRLPALKQTRSFLFPAGAFHGEATPLPLIAKGDAGLLAPDSLAGKRVLCLVEAAANSTIIRRLFPAASRVDFVLQGEHQTVTKLAAERRAAGHQGNVLQFDSILALGETAERECAERNIEFFRSMTAFFESLFDSVAALRKYRPYSPFLAGYAEPPTYFWCFVAPKALATAIESCRPDVIVVVCAEGRYFLPLLPCLLQRAGDIPVLIGHSHHDSTRRLEVAERIRDISDPAAAWRQHPVSEAAGAQPGGEPGPELALALHRMEQAVEYSLAQSWPELDYRKFYGAISTIATAFVGYNYTFRRHLLSRLAGTFDLNLFMLNADTASRTVLQGELQAAGNVAGKSARLVAYASNLRGFHNALGDFLTRNRSLWQPRLVELAGGAWVIPVFESIVFPRMVGELAAAFEYISYLDSTFRMSPPAFALAITGETSSAAILLTAARQAGVPTFDLQVVAMNDEPRNRIALLPKADHFFAMDVQSAELLASWGWRPEGLHPNGTVRFDQLQQLDLAAHRQQGRAQFAGRDFRHLILFVSQAQSDDYCHAVVSVIARLIAQRPEVALLVKLHPREAPGSKQQYESILQETAPAGNWKVAADIAIDDALPASDLVIGIYSLALLEAACLGIPVIAANLSGKRFPEPTNFGDRDCILGAATEDELTDLIGALLDKEAFRADFLARQREYFRHHAYMVDRNAMTRIAQTIEEVVEKRPIAAKSLLDWRGNDRAAAIGP